MFDVKRMEVVYLMSHLVITLTVLIAYVVLTITGHADETLKNLLLIIGGFWFGAVGGQQFKANQQKKNDAANGEDGKSNEQ